MKPPLPLLHWAGSKSAKCKRHLLVGLSPTARVFKFRLVAQYSSRKVAFIMRAMEKEPTFQADSLLTSYQVGSILQVNPSSINKWVKDGRIPAFRTPGGHRRFRAADIVAFLSSHNMPVPESLQAASLRRVLVVDEDQHTLEALRFALAPYQKSVKVVCVANSVDALMQIGAMRPHMVLLGTHLTGVDGFEVCRRLKASEETRAMQVVMVSTDADGDNERKRADEAGASVFLRRPLDVSQVLRELKLLG